MYDGFWEVFIGFTGTVLSFFRKNRKDPDASFLRRYNRQILLFGGLVMIAYGTFKFIT